jgi:YD repeat-containing protein
MRHRAVIAALLTAASLLAQPALAESSTYTYDALGRVLTQTDWDGTVVTFSYDPAGNRTQRVTTAATEHRPVAVNDTASGTSPITLDPRTNDSDPDGDTLSVAGATNGAHGTTTFTSTGLTYAATSGYTGPDTFAYTLSDGHGGTATAYVNVTVSAPSSPTHVNPNPVWSDIVVATNTTGSWTGVNANQTIQGITTSITLQLQKPADGATLHYSKNNGSWTLVTGSSSTVTASAGDTLRFEITAACAGGTVSVVNQSDSNTVIGSFNYDFTNVTC